MNTVSEMEQLVILVILVILLVILLLGKLARQLVAEQSSDTSQVKSSQVKSNTCFRNHRKGK